MEGAKMALNKNVVPGKISQDKHVEGPLIPTKQMIRRRNYWFSVARLFKDEESETQMDGQRWVLSVIKTKLAAFLDASTDDLVVEFTHYNPPLVTVKTNQPYKRATG